MAFYGGGTREGPEAWAKISRRNFWPGSKRRLLSLQRHTTIGDMIWNRIPMRELRKTRSAYRRSRVFQWDRGGNTLHPRPHRGLSS